MLVYLLLDAPTRLNACGTCFTGIDELISHHILFKTTYLDLQEKILMKKKKQPAAVPCMI
jgi:hypothetical protein